jgi:hypothetical protein
MEVDFLRFKAHMWLLLRGLYASLCRPGSPLKPPSVPRETGPANGSNVVDVEDKIGGVHRICKVLEGVGLEAYR